MKSGMIKSLLLLCVVPAFANAATESKYSSKETVLPKPTGNVVSAAQAEVEARKVFCGIQGKGCEAENLESRCAAVEDRKKTLVAFKCSVHAAEAGAKAGFEALNVNLNHNLAYISSVKADRPPMFNPAKQTRTETNSKGGQR